MSIVLHCYDSYVDMIKRVMKSRELSCGPSHVVISYLLNKRGKIYPTFINNDRNVKLYMLCVDFNNSRVILRVKVIESSWE